MIADAAAEQQEKCLSLSRLRQNADFAEVGVSFDFTYVMHLFADLILLFALPFCVECTRLQRVVFYAFFDIVYFSVLIM